MSKLFWFICGTLTSLLIVKLLDRQGDEIQVEFIPEMPTCAWCAAPFPEDNLLAQHWAAIEYEDGHTEYACGLEHANLITSLCRSH